jgi:hypothetical protein
VAFENRPRRELLIEAVRYGERPEVRARLTQVVDRAMDRDHLRRLLSERALAADTMDARRVQAIREDMERAEARRLQPHYVASFFQQAFALLGGSLREREPDRFEITHVPAAVRNRDRQVGSGEPVLPRYERVTFEKSLISVPGKPLAAFICPGHPLLDATLDLVLERHRDLLKRGAVLVDPQDPGERVRALVYLDHSIQDARTDQRAAGFTPAVLGGAAVLPRRVVSRQLHFVEMDEQGRARAAGYAPYLDYRPITAEERVLVEPLLRAEWLKTAGVNPAARPDDLTTGVNPAARDTAGVNPGARPADLEGMATSFAVAELVPPHLAEVRSASWS